MSLSSPSFQDDASGLGELALLFATLPDDDVGPPEAHAHPRDDPESPHEAPPPAEEEGLHLCTLMDIVGMIPTM